MTYGELNDDVTDDVTWPESQIVTPIRSEPNISKQLEMLFSNNR